MPAVERNITLHVAWMVGGVERWSLRDDFTTTTKGGKRQLIRDGGSATQISNKLRPPDPGGGVLLTTTHTKTPAENQDRPRAPDEHMCFPLAQEPVEQPVPRSAGGQSTHQTDRKLDSAVKESAFTHRLRRC